MPPLNPLVLVFTILAIVKLRRSAESAALDVFLPVLLLVPTDFWLHIPHLPPLSCVDAVVLPIGVATLISRWSQWQFKRTDLWITLFLLAWGYTDYINIGLSNALYNFPSAVCDILLAYCIGKLLIEQSGIREQFAQRMVVLLAATGFISIIEFIGRKNPFLMVGRRFFSDNIFWNGAMRGGFMRVEGPFAGAEEAGIVFLMGFFLALWLWFANKSRGNVNEPKYFGLRRSTLWVCGIVLGLYMTLSRGPWSGAAAGFLIAHIGLAKNRRRAMILALVLGTIGGIYAHKKADQYAQIDLEDATEAQSSAQYRTKLYDVYKPVAEKGGLFGWSATAYPRDIHLDSIDNEYIFLWVANGKVGVSLFVLIAAEGAFAILMAVIRSRRSVDTCFYYCLGGMLVGLLLVLITVFLTGQGFLMFFFFIGWSQSLREQPGEFEALPQGTTARFSFRRVFA